MKPRPFKHFLQKRSLRPSGPGRLPMRTPLRQVGQNRSTLDASTGISFDSRPPWRLRWLGRMWRYTRLMPSTTTLPSSGKTRRTRPVDGASSPVMICTVSSLRMCMILVFRSAGGPPALALLLTPRKCRRAACTTFSHHFGGEADDFQKAAVTQLAGHGAEDALALGIVVFLIQDDQGVAVEADVAAVVAAR